MSQLEYIDISVIPKTHPVQKFYDYWETLFTEQDMAVWDSSLVSAVPEAMSWASILIAEATNRYLCRFCGSSYEQMIGLHHQGLYLDEALPEEALAARVRELVDVSNGMGPLFSQTTLPFKKREYIKVYRGIFGFITETSKIDRFVVIIAPAY